MREKGGGGEGGMTSLVEVGIEEAGAGRLEVDPPMSAIAGRVSRFSYQNLAISSVETSTPRRCAFQPIFLISLNIIEYIHIHSGVGTSTVKHLFSTVIINNKTTFTFGANAWRCEPLRLRPWGSHASGLPRH